MPKIPTAMDDAPETGPKFAPLPDSLSKQERDLINYHRTNLLRGTYIDEPDHGITTILMTGVTGPDGRQYNVPGYFDGKIQTPEASWERAKRMGWDKFPSYSTIDEGKAKADFLHKIIEDDTEVFKASRGR